MSGIIAGLDCDHCAGRGDFASLFSVKIPEPSIHCSLGLLGVLAYLWLPYIENILFSFCWPCCFLVPLFSLIPFVEECQVSDLRTHEWKLVDQFYFGLQGN